MDLVHRRGSALKTSSLKLSTPHAFTLLEVILAMGLLSIVIGGVYGIANGAITLGKAMTDSRIHESRVMNFTAAWREYLEGLPPNTRITVGTKPSRTFGRGSFLVENGSVPFAWSPRVRLAPAVEFKLKRIETSPGSSTLWVRHLERPKKASVDDYKVISELPLLENLREFTWEFYDAPEEEWVTYWEDEPHPPLYMKLRFGFAYEPKSKVYEYTFWISGGNQVNEAPAGQRGQPTQPPAQPPPGGQPR
jgi:prepilin-type N-terminal cleavage/methylation domain-containing protein